MVDCEAIIEEIKKSLKQVLFLTVFLFFSVPPCQGQPSHRLIKVEHNKTDIKESVDLVLSHQSEYKTFNLNQPLRFVIDIETCYFQPVHSIMGIHSKFIDRIRISQFKKNMVRVVIDKRKNFQGIHLEQIAAPQGFKIRLSLGTKTITIPEKISNDVEKKSTLPDPLLSFSEQQPTEDKDDQNLDSLFSIPEDNILSLDEEIEEVSPGNRHSKLLVSGDFRNETAYRINRPHHFSKIKNILNLKASGELSNKLSYFVGYRCSYDAVFDLTKNYNQSVEDDQKWGADLRDAYVDLSLGNFDLRLGNQQIVWGQAVGLFFADIVNPKDLREYILPDLDQIRIPVPAVNLESYHENLYFQFVFIPFPEFNKFGKRGSEFDFSKPFYDTNADIISNDPSDPSRSLDNSEVGGRISWYKNGWDMALFYFYDYYNFPVNYRYLSANASGSLNPVTIIYKPAYERMHRSGSTFSKEIKDAIVKGEFIYSSNMFYESSDTSDMDGIVQSPSFDWLFGVDYTFLNALDTNFQIMQNIALDHESSMIKKKYSTSFSIWLKTGLFDDVIEPECFFVSSLNQTDWLFSPKIAYNFNATLKVIFGADIFGGSTDGDFGRFSENDRIYSEVLLIF